MIISGGNAFSVDELLFSGGSAYSTDDEEGGIKMINFDKGTITSWDTLTAFNRDGELEFVIDELQDFTLNNEETRDELTGRGGRVIKIIKRAKSATGTGTNGFVSGGMLAAQLGSEAETVTTVRRIDPISVAKDATTATTTYTATGTTGKEIGTLYVSADDVTILSNATKLTQVAATPGEGEFTYNPSTKTITFHDGDITKDTVVYAIYDTTVTNGVSITNDADKYSKTLNGQIDFTWEDACDGIHHGAILFDRGDFDGSFDLGGSDTITHGFTINFLPNLCLGKQELYKIVIFED